MRTFSIFFTAALFTASSVSFSALAEDHQHHSMAAHDHAAMSHSDLSHSDMSHNASSDTSAKIYTGIGVVKAWNEESVSIAHQPIPQLNWPSMVMSFELQGYTGKTFPAEQQIEFTFKQTDSGYALVSADAK
ncbi:MAG: copper-binding protein [Enterobacteriaceae bacterium]|nr:copper-binding protein [Enterobacteriaceae bacterium]